MRILITGGFGFVGGRVAQRLHQAGHQIVLGSRKANSSPNWLLQAEVVKTDWNDAHALELICNRVDVVIHAAGMNAQDCAADPVAALEFNGLATARLVAAASRVGVKRFIYLSTAHVYASPLTGTISENTCPRNLHPYATSHLAGENAVLHTSQRGQIAGIVLRLSNAFGAPVHKEVNCWMLLVNDLCRQAVETGKMVLHSNGLQQRDFIAMAEICCVIEQISYRELDFGASTIFNVGSGRSQSVLEMVQLIQQRCKHVLDFEPKLYLPELGEGERHEKLEYQADRLAKIGVNVNTDNSDEIDELLSFCYAWFN
jgi:UDP-glucose 4-epimerase